MTEKCLLIEAREKCKCEWCLMMKKITEQQVGLINKFYMDKKLIELNRKLENERF